VFGQVISDKLDGLLGSLFGKFSQCLEDNWDYGVVKILTDWHRLEVFCLQINGRVTYSGMVRVR